MLVKKLIIASIPFLLTACTNEAENNAALSAAATKPVSLKIDISTPDRAIRSWWNFRDVAAYELLQECLKNGSGPRKEQLKSVSSVATEAVLKEYQAYTAMCRPFHQYSREIQEAKLETETRAIVYALVKDITVIPLGAVPNESEKRWRAQGLRGKYLLEKMEDGWKVSQVYEFDDYKSNGTGSGWTEVYKRTLESPPDFASLVTGDDL